MSEPTGVVVADNDADELRTDETWTVLEDGRVRQLRLRVARGVVRDLPGYEIPGTVWAHLGWTPPTAPRTAP